MNYLIVGGNSTAGQSAIRAIRESDSNALIIATTSGTGEISGADRSVPNIDLSKDVVDSVAAAVGSLNLRALFFTPAFGPIGFPVAATTLDDIRKGLAFSYDPMVNLTNRLHPDITVGYSAFYWLPHTLTAYGAMAYVKLAQEKLAVENPRQYRMIRAGTFASKASRGVGLIVQRNAKNTQHAALRELADMWRKSGMKFSDFFFDYAFACEIKAFGDRFSSSHRATDESGLTKTAAKILSGEASPIVNVIGDWVWTDSSLPELPTDFTLGTSAF